MPAVNLNQRLLPKWTLNCKWEARTGMLERDWGQPSRSDFRYLQSDFSVLGGYKSGGNQKWIGGYMMRLRGYVVIHRSIQQFAFVNQFRSFRLGHRLALDQTFVPGQAAIFRMRYRITAEVPLNGHSADPGEFYLRLNHEYLQIWQAGYDLEVRLVPLLGYVLTSGEKFEIGLDYRINRFLAKRATQRFWISLNWYVKT